MKIHKISNQQLYILIKTFFLIMEKYRVQKLLSNYGYCSRRRGEQLIQEGRVKVNGELITIGDEATFNDKITVDGKPVNKDQRVYLIFHKPVGCVTALTDDRYKTIADYITLKERVFPIGRLDYNTSGLLLLTNDGNFANNVMHPRYEVKKTYLVGVDRIVKKEDVKHLERGVMLEDGKTAPAKVKPIDPNTIEITIHEGKNRIIRRMLKELKFRIRFLHRVRIGDLGIGNLGKGKYKPLTEDMKKKIFL